MLVVRLSLTPAKAYLVRVKKGREKRKKKEVSERKQSKKGQEIKAKKGVSK